MLLKDKSNLLILLRLLADYLLLKVHDIYIMRMDVLSGKRMGLSQMFNEIKGEIYHEYYGNHHSGCRVSPIVRGWRRVVLEKKKVG